MAGDRVVMIQVNMAVNIAADGACHPGGHYWDHTNDTLSLHSSHCNFFSKAGAEDFLFLQQPIFGELGD